MAGIIPSAGRYDAEDARLDAMKATGRAGAHLCYEWDYMAIADGDPEMDACLCDLSAVRAKDAQQREG